MDGMSKRTRGREKDMVKMRDGENGGEKGEKANQRHCGQKHQEEIRSALNTEKMINLKV